MSVLLSCQLLTKSYHHRPLFRDISLGIEDNERVGLIGPNGSGKSTLLRILVDEERPDGGAVSLRRSVRTGYVPQEDVLPTDKTVAQVLEDALSSEILEDYERWTRMDIMLGKTGFPDREQRVGALSGGWRKRLAIARELIREPDLLLMDEPTNHLDLEGILWLEKLLSTSAFACLVVSHDRYFLENVTNRVIELSRAYAEGYLSVSGSYSEFLVRREEYLAAQAHQEQALASQVRREIEWLRRGARARTTKSISRIQEAGRMIGDLAELRVRNSQEKTAGIDFTATGRRTKELLAAHGLERKLGGRSLFRRISFVLSPGTRLGLLGPNGSGKTTLLRLLSGELEPDSGSVKRAENLRIVRFDQHREQLDLEMTLRTALAGENESVNYRGGTIHVSAWAKRFLFETEQLNMRVKHLSGGEQARILIARLMLQPADLLILDEPTNDLDIPSLEVLEESLADFPGALVLVTHDRFLLDRLSTQILALDGNGSAGFFADTAQWEEARSRAEAEKPSPPAAAPKPAPRSAPPSPARFSAKEQRELDGMEAKIMAAEAELKKVMQQLEDPTILANHLRVREASEQIQAAQDRIEALYARWEELEARRPTDGV